MPRLTDSVSIFPQRKTYQKFKKYYKREMVYCSGEDGFETFSDFSDRHSKFIIKPLDLFCGKAVQIIDISECTDRKALYEEWLGAYNNKFILEEFIEQAPELAKLHPSSVNTVRMPTIRMDDGMVIVHPQLRMGHRIKDSRT